MLAATDIIPQIGPVKNTRVFTLEEAQALLPVVRKITAAAYEELVPVRRQFENTLPTDPRINGVEKSYEAIVRRWVAKMERLGLVVNGLWLVDFDTGDGYLCWKYPEIKLAYFHEYDSGYGGRRPLPEVIDELAPEWA